MIRAYLFALDPTDDQAEAMRSHCGAQRVAYNWCLARVRANWAQRAAEQTYGLTGDQLTPWINTSAYGLRLAWNIAKPDVAPWWAENSKEAYASGCANLSTALGNRKAGRARMPRFKSKHRSRLTCRFTTGAFGLGADRRHVKLPVIGAIRTGESTRKLARKVEAGTARIRSATLSWQRGRWHVSFSVETPDVEPAQIHTQVAAQRRDHLHKLTSRLVHDHDTIVIEDLAVANMLRNRCLARHIAGVSWAELRRQLTYKSAAASVQLIVANRWFASSKTCSGCGTAKAKLALSERTYVCMACGFVLNRDENAARNLAALAADTGELRRELPAGSDVRPVVLARPAVAPPREDRASGQRPRREAVAR